MSYNHQ